MIDFIGVAGNNTASAGLVINKPACIAGDVLLAVVGSGGAKATTYTLPTGWNILFEEHLSNTYYGDIRVYYKVAGASEPSSYTFQANADPLNGHRGAIISFRGVDTSNIFNAYASTNSGNDATVNPHICPSITTTAPNCYILRGWSIRQAGTTWTKPALTNIWDASTTHRPAILVMGAIQPLTGVTGTASATSSNTYRDATFTLALNPSGDVPQESNLHIWSGSAWKDILGVNLKRFVGGEWNG